MGECESTGFGKPSDCADVTFTQAIDGPLATRLHSGCSLPDRCSRTGSRLASCGASTRAAHGSPYLCPAVCDGLQCRSLPLTCQTEIPAPLRPYRGLQSAVLQTHTSPNRRRVGAHSCAPSGTANTYLTPPLRPCRRLQSSFPQTHTSPRRLHASQPRLLRTA